MSRINVANFRHPDGTDDNITLDSSGRVGVGTASPGSKFEVNSGADNAAAEFVSTDARVNIGFADSGSTLYSGLSGVRVGADGDNLALYTANSESARIDSGGRLLVGTTSSSNEPRLVVVGNQSNNNGSGWLALGRGEGASTIANNEGLGAISFTDNAQNEFARIQADADAAAGAGDYPGRLTFSTTADGASSPTERMRIDRNGNVEIRENSNTVSTGASLYLFDTAGAANGGSSSGRICFYSSDSTDGPSIRSEISNNYENSSADSALLFKTYNGTLGERLRIDSSGRLLVGTSNARSNFFNSSDYSGLLQIEGRTDSTRVISFVYNTSGPQQPLVVIGKSRGTAAGSNTVVQNNDNLGTISFQGADGTELVEAARISCQVEGTPGANDMPGRLTFSTTADGATNALERMRLTADGTLLTFSAGNGVVSGHSAAAGTSAQLFLGIHSRTSTTVGGTTSFRVFTNGNVQNTNNSYGAISDIKLKENIVDANSQWDDLKALQVRNYNFKEGQTHTQIGLVAQEVELISSGLVYESPDRDAEGNDLGTVTKSVNYSVLYMKAVKALQEAMERIETLEQRLSDAGIA
jgi:hypothetical protein